MRSPRLVTLSQGITALFSLLPSLSVCAANVETLWGLAEQQSQLHSFSLAYDKHKAQGFQLPEANPQGNSEHSLQFIKGFTDSQSNTTHLRYEQYYQGLPVWGAQLIYHLSSKNKTWVTGKLVSNIERDLPYVEHKLSADQALAKALAKKPKSLRAQPKITPIIYVQAKKALSAYHVMYGGFNNKKQAALHEFIINAQNGEIIQYWDGLTSGQVEGTGPGGVEVQNLPYRAGNYQFGNLTSGTNTLGRMKVNYDGAGTCSITNSQFRVINLENQVIDMESQTALPDPTYSYSCSAPNYTNPNDSGYAPINKGLSPINDVTYFTQEVFAMYKNVYKVANPIGSSSTSLPVRSFTHLGEYDNAFACDIECLKAAGYGGSTQIMVYGNGVSQEATLLPLTSVDIVGHELSHLVTSNFSKLIYQNQSGGINESFSDMAGIALESYINQITNPFKIWNGPAANAPAAWTIGQAVSATTPPKPFRYLNNPPLDGHSIGNAANYYSGINPHYSSGVFNKAFYLLSTTPGWTVERAFQIMLDANMSYWIPSTTYEYGACGVIQAAANRAYNYSDVINAFKKVGVNCRVGIMRNV